MVEDFFPINDLSTVAVGASVDGDREMGGISGHIETSCRSDSGRIRILDYKSDARKQKYAQPQLNSYAKAPHISHKNSTKKDRMRLL